MISIRKRPLPELAIVVFTLVLVIGTDNGFAAPWKVYYGNLHSHSAASDGVDTAPVAYSWARQEANLNFLCLSEHNHMVSQAALNDDVTAADAATANGFVGLVGQEFSKLPPNGGNHVNIHNLLTVIPDERNNDYRFIYHELLPQYAIDHPGSIVVCQFNHPDNPNHDYGAAAIGSIVNYQGDANAFLRDADPWVKLIAIISGPADSNVSKAATPLRDAHEDTTARMIEAWHTYLDRGFHLSPVADQDNHRRSWGTRTTARTGVWLDEPLTRDSLLRALKAGRCFATEDKDLSVWFEWKGKPMGSVVPDDGSGSVTFSVTIEDGSEPNSHYQVELLHDLIGDGKLASRVGALKLCAAGETFTLTSDHVPGTHEAFFIHVKQKDTASDQDDAWSAPIWIDPAISPEAPHHLANLELPAEVQFVGSKGSLVYHRPDCRVLQTILPVNRQFYTNAPALKRLHKNCPTI